MSYNIYIDIQELVPAGPDRSPSRMVVGLVPGLLGLVCKDLNKGLIDTFLLAACTCAVGPLWLESPSNWAPEKILHYYSV